MMPHDLRRVVLKLACETMQVVDSGLGRKEFKKRKILTGERSEGPESRNGKEFSHADSEECQSLRLLRWEQGRTVGWSMPPETQSAAKALKCALATCLPRFSSKIAAERLTIKLVRENQCLQFV